MPNKTPMYYLIGVVGKPHGVKGEIKVINLSDFDRFKVGEVIIINNNEHEIISLKNQHKNLIIGLSNINNIDEANSLKGFEIFTENEPKLKEDEYHLPKLINLLVFNQDNKEIGVVESLVPQHNGYLLRVETNENEFVLIPFIKEFVTEVTDTKIYINEIPGLIKWLLI